MGCGGRGCEWLPRWRTLPMPILGAIRVTSGEIGARRGWPWGDILREGGSAGSAGCVIGEAGVAF